MKLILVRHGQTNENKQGIIMGQNPGELSAEGITSAKKLARVLRSKNINYVVSSDLKRCVDTTNILITGRDISVSFDERFREINFGEHQGKPYSVVSGDYTTNLDKKLPAGESNRQLITRVIGCINENYRNHPKDTVLVVSHSGAISVILAAYHRLSFAKALTELKIANTNTVEIEITSELPYSA